MKETDYMKTLKSGFETSLEEYSNMPLPDNKVQASQIVMREAVTISNEEKRILEEKNQEERFQLAKDHQYWSEKFEEKKEDFNEKIQILRAENDKTNNEIQKATLEFNQRMREDELKFKKISMITTILGIAIPATVNVLGIIVSVWSTKLFAKLIYIDEGRPTTELKDASKSIYRFMSNK